MCAPDGSSFCGSDETYPYNPVAPSEVELVAVVTVGYQNTSKQCHYSNFTASLVHQTWNIELREARTATIVSQTALEGDYLCPSSTVLGNATVSDSRNLHDNLTAWLAQYGS